jgi:peroxiredoxin
MAGLSLAAGGRLQLGEPAPEVLEGGRVVFRAEKQGPLLLVVSPCDTAAACEAELVALGRVQPELDKLGFPIAVVVGSQPRGSQLPFLKVTVDHSNVVRRAYGAVGQRLAFLVENGMVRRVVPVTRSDAEIVGVVKVWEEGRKIYSAQCSRCHGEDGKDTSYPGTKSLGGIGNRISEEEILHRTLLTGAVDLTPLKDASRKALAAYVAGL